MLTKPVLESVSAGVEAYTDLIAAYAARDDAESAERVYTLMRTRSIEPNEVTLSVLMAALVGGNRIETADEIVREQVAKFEARNELDQATIRLKPLLGSYVIGMCKLCVNNKETSTDTMNGVDIQTSQGQSDAYLTRAQTVLLQMETLEVLPDNLILNAFILALSTSTRPSRVTDMLTIFSYMYHSDLESIRPNEYTYSILYTALGREREIDIVSQLFLASDAYSVDMTVINSLLRAFVDSARPLDALQVYIELFTDNNSPDNKAQQTKQSFDTSDRSDRSNNKNIKSTLSEKCRAIRRLHPPDRFTPSKVTFTILFLAIANSLKRDHTRASPTDSVWTSPTTAPTTTATRSIQGKPVSQGGKNKKKRAVTPTVNEATASLIFNEESGRFYEKGSGDSSSSKSSSSKSSSSSSAFTLEELFDGDSTDDSNTNLSEANTLPLPFQNRNQLLPIVTSPRNQPFNPTIDISKLNPFRGLNSGDNTLQSNDILLKLYRDMRFTYTVEPDDIMVSVLRAMFSMNTQSSRTSKYYTNHMRWIWPHTMCILFSFVLHVMSILYTKYVYIVLV